MDADRDGVVEKNNPRKVPSYQGTRPWTGGLPGGWGRAPGWMLQTAVVLPASSDSFPFTDKETEAQGRLPHTARPSEPTEGPGAL